MQRSSRHVSWDPDATGSLLINVLCSSLLYNIHNQRYFLFFSKVSLFFCIYFSHWYSLCFVYVYEYITICLLYIYSSNKISKMYPKYLILRLCGRSDGPLYTKSNACANPGLQSCNFCELVLKGQGNYKKRGVRLKEVRIKNLP